MDSKRVNTSEGLRRFNRNALVVGILWLIIMVSGIAVVYANHLSRQLLSELETKRRVGAELHVVWGQYLLEQSTWAAYSRVQNVAADELEMGTPAQEQLVVIRN
ncbi:cell division protein FtsL [Gilvimarinus sp. F26214L]|uniref:cell division protein FtsL n=1 Tax=Gilvimarinus sp. DZF01 TaxID=3461371 RepID=UPI00404669F6